MDELAPPYDRKVIVQGLLPHVKKATDNGVKTICDANPSDCSGDPLVDKEIAERTGLNIIMCAGMHNEASGITSYLKLRKRVGFDAQTELYETYMKQITVGIRNTGVKVGFLKVCTGLGKISEYEEMCLRAAGRAAKETGVPIETHTDGSTMGVEQADMFMAEGVEPKRIMIGHMGATADLAYYARVLEKGVYLGFDRLGIYNSTTLSQAVTQGIVCGLISMGYANRILLSHDHVPFVLGRNSDLFIRQNPGWNYAHIFTSFIPGLKKGGISDETIKTIMVDNPRRFFGDE